MKHRLGLVSNSDLVTVLGTKINNLSKEDAVRVMEGFIKEEKNSFHSVFFANTHTLNLADQNPDYRNVLNSANAVFGDGTGVKWAAKLYGIRLKDNLVGTDLIPCFLQKTSNLGYRYFLLGGQPDLISRAAEYASNNFPGWNMVGFHHGYFESNQATSVIEKINSACPHILLVGMGNPNQEMWIHKYKSQLKIPLVAGVGGLFHYWAGDLNRSPRFLRNLGMEWLGILLQQPHKWRRYVIGNPKFLLRLITVALSESIIGMPNTTASHRGNSYLESLPDSQQSSLDKVKLNKVESNKR